MATELIAAFVIVGGIVAALYAISKIEDNGMFDTVKSMIDSLVYGNADLIFIAPSKCKITILGRSFSFLKYFASINAPSFFQVLQKTRVRCLVFVNSL